MTIRFFPLVVVLTLMPALRIPPGFAQGPTTLIRLDSTITYQTMTGWEATAWARDPLPRDTITNQSNANPAFPFYAPTLFDQAVNDLGLNRVRLELGPSLENTVDYFTEYLTGQIPFSDYLPELNPVNDDGDPFSVDAYINSQPDSSDIPGFIFSGLDYKVDTMITPLQQLLQARGEHLFVNVCYVAFGQPSFVQYTNAEEYAEFVLAVYQHLKNKYGWVPDSWEIMLEPDNTPCTGTMMGQLIQATAARLRNHGFTPQFVAPSVTNMNNFFP